MALFFSFPTGGRSKPQCLSWCNTDSILAVGTANNTVDFFLEEGDALPECTIKQVSRPVKLQWHPHKPVLAVGYSKGKLLLWDHHSRTLGENRKQPHLQMHAAITFIEWSPDGSRVISGDAAGNVCVWSYRGRGMTTLLAKYRSKGAVYHAVFCAPPKTSDSNKSSTGVTNASRIAASCPPFFFGGDSGEIFYADDMGNKATVQDMQSPIHAILYHHTQQRLVILTKKLMLAQLKVTPDGSVSPVMKVKLSMAAEGGINNACWAGDGLLATCAGEQNVRFWDLSHNSNYLLSLSMHNIGAASGTRKISKADRIITIDYNPRKRVLAAGTRDGNVVMWKNLAVAPSATKDDVSTKAKSASPSQKRKTSSAFNVVSQSRAVRPPSTKDSWKTLPVVGMNGRIKSLQWGAGEQLLAAETADNVTILSETVLHRKMFGPVAAIQVSSDQISIQRTASSNAEPMILRTGIRIKGMDLHGTSLIVWNGRKCEVYSIPKDQSGDSDAEPTRQGSFPTKSKACAVHNDNIFCAVGSRVEVCNFQGTVKTALSFTEAEGQPLHIDSNLKYLAVVTTTGVLKMFDISRREPRQLGSAGKFVDSKTGDDIGVVRSVRCNSDGTCMSLLADRKAGAYLRTPDERIHVYNLDLAAISSYDFGPSARYPVAHAWDPEEARLLVCETYKLLKPTTNKEDDSGESSSLSSKKNVESGGSSSSSSNNSTSSSSKESEEKKSDADEQNRIKDIQIQKSQLLDIEQQAEIEVTTIFATIEHGLLKQDSRPLEMGLNSLLGLHVPNLYFVSQPEKNSDSSIAVPRLVRKALRDFAGLDRVDDDIKRALMDFSYYLTIGDMDLAYKAVRLIEEPQVWESMALMCVKTKRLDVAEVCLGMMGHARGARAVREASSEPELDARIAMVAVQLGLLEDAEQLYSGCGRWDLLNRLYQSSGQWDKAIQIAQARDRVHMRTTHFKYAQFLESVGDVRNAIRHYELSGTHYREVPRMLHEAGQIDNLGRYVRTKDDPKLYKWWGQYCEYRGDLANARQYYTRAKDFLSLVRVHCHDQDFENAADVVLQTGDKAAAYYLAQQHELNKNINDAIDFYSRAGRYNHAVRLAQNSGLDNDLMRLSVMSSKETMLSSARYFEAKGDMQSAVSLYQKSGAVTKALNLCFRAKLFDDLRQIADSIGNLGSQADPETLAKCAAFFVEHKQHDKAVHLYVMGGRIGDAIDMCLDQKVIITDDLAAKMTPAKPPKKGEKLPPGSATPLTKEKRVEILMKLARVCKKQGSYHLATKKYTQAGDKLKAMKCLLKSGDTEKIIFFANVSRNRDIYILAANYLQNLDWHNNPATMKSIITFYTKAKAFEQLSSFYDACANVEIDEYRDYAKALGALNEAERYLSKARNTPAATKQERLAVLQQRIILVERFVQARKLIKEDPSETVQICTQLLASGKQIDNAIRVGDVFALLIEYYYKINDYQKAFSLIEQMRDRNIILSPYLDQKMTDTIFKEVGESSESMRGGKDADVGEEGVIGEEIPDEIGGEIVSDGDDMYGANSSGSDDEIYGANMKK